MRPIVLLVLAACVHAPVRPAPILRYECALSGTHRHEGRTCWWETCEQLEPFNRTSTGWAHWVQTSDGRYWGCDLRQGQVCHEERAQGAAHCERVVRPEFPTAELPEDMGP